MAKFHKTIIPIGIIRPNDILILLAAGVSVEVLVRFYLFSAKLITAEEQKLRSKLKALRLETAHKRQLGPSAFVETSKLERQLLSIEKELNQMDEKRNAKVKKREKIAKKFTNAISFIVFVLYFGVQLLSLDGFRVALQLENNTAVATSQEFESAIAASFLKRLLFPISYVGLGIKISKLGLPQKASSIGALLIYWCGQTFAAKLLTICEALFVQSY